MPANSSAMPRARSTGASHGLHGLRAGGQRRCLDRTEREPQHEERANPTASEGAAAHADHASTPRAGRASRRAGRTSARRAGRRAGRRSRTRAEPAVLRVRELEVRGDRRCERGERLAIEVRQRHRGGRRERDRSTGRARARSAPRSTRSGLGAVRHDRSRAASDLGLTDAAIARSPACRSASAASSRADRAVARTAARTLDVGLRRPAPRARIRSVRAGPAQLDRVLLHDERCRRRRRFS